MRSEYIIYIIWLKRQTIYWHMFLYGVVLNIISGVILERSHSQKYSKV